jgi:mono/diheme cytochrome c family protein
LLVEKSDANLIPLLSEMAKSSRNPLAQLHALWTLDGMGGVDWVVLKDALQSSHPKVRSAAIRLSEKHLTSSQQPVVIEHLLSHQFDVPEVQMQLALTLGETDSKDALEALVSILIRNATNEYIRGAVLSGVEGKEAALLNSVLAQSPWWSQKNPEAAATILTELASCIMRSRDVSSIKSTFETATELKTHEATSLLTGFRDAAFKRSQGEWVPAGQPIRLDSPLHSLTTLASSPDAKLSELAKALYDAFSWPGKADLVINTAVVKPLTAEQQKRFDTGRDLFLISCGACHQPHGMGQEGLAPPLKDSDWSTGSKERMIRIVLHGLQGPIEIQGKQWELVMPGLAVFDDEQLASIMTYVRREWGHTASPVEPEEIKAIRDQYPGREDMWTVKELLKFN